jgi:capsid assembly protease
MGTQAFHRDGVLDEAMLLKHVASPWLMQRFLNTPLFLEGRRAAAMLESLRTGERETRSAGIVLPKQGEYRPYGLVNGVAIIEIRGILVHGCGWGWGEVDYAWIAQCVDAAAADGEARGIALHIDSPGGEVAGCFDLADKIYALREIKPVWAILDECAYSAAYALASAASKVYVPRTGGVGSVGVIALRVDITRALEMAGITLTTLSHGERKTDTYPTTELSEEARDRLQADIDTLGE